MVTASLATYPARRDQLERTVASLLPQVDRLNVYLNEYTESPDFLAHPKIQTRLGGPNLGDAGKFAWTDQVSGHHLICDDDICYPPDYALQMVQAIEKYQRRAVVGLHAVWLKQPVASYYHDRRVLNAAHALVKDEFCHLLATNSVAYHTDTLRICPRDFPVPNYADPFFAVLTQQQRIPCVAIRRPAGWIHHLTVTDCLYAKFSRGDDALHTKLIQLLQPWRIHNPMSPA